MSKVTHMKSNPHHREITRSHVFLKCSMLVLLSWRKLLIKYLECVDQKSVRSKLAAERATICSEQGLENHLFWMHLVIVRKLPIVRRSDMAAKPFVILETWW